MIGSAAGSSAQFRLLWPDSTGKERDTETGLDYFGARYMSGPEGRFISPDPVAGRLANPQSLNRYTYALNNPLKYVDPTGMVVEWADSEAKCKKGETECRTKAQRDYENNISKLKNSKKEEDQEKGKRLEATYNRLQDSTAVFRVVSEAAAGSSGEIGFDGNAFIISLKGDTSLYGAITQNQKLGHEFEHGRQVLDKELSFHDYDGDGTWLPFAHDRNDEAKAFAAGFDAEPAGPSQGSFLNGISRALQGGVAAGAEYLGGDKSRYRRLDLGPSTVQTKSPAVYQVPR